MQASRPLITIRNRAERDAMLRLAEALAEQPLASAATEALGLLLDALDAFDHGCDSAPVSNTKGNGSARPRRK